MYKNKVANQLNWIAGTTLFLVTIIITPNTNLDPINLPKLWVLSIFGFSILAILMCDLKLLTRKINIPYLIAALALPFFMGISMLFSNSPLNTQFFGTYARNTGLLTYFSLACIFLGLAIGTNSSLKKPFLFAVIGAVATNIIYGLIQSLGLDWINWNSVYSPVFGTFGNPDFVSAFLGFTSAFGFTYLLLGENSIFVRMVSGTSILLSLMVIYNSKAVQGLVVMTLVAVSVLFFVLNSLINSYLIKLLYLVFVGFFSILAILGTLQIGPLTNLLYRSSITQRGDYWHAGLNMLWSNPLTGVGLDSFGDWYRYFRSPEAADRFNGTVVSNSAHNLLLDIASTAGLIACASYILMIALAVKSCWHIIKSDRYSDPLFVSVFSAWIGYLAQSLISINNLALAIWGWVLPGFLIAMERWHKEGSTDYKIKGMTKIENRKINLSLISGLIIGAIVGFFPFKADVNFRNALESGEVTKLYTAARIWPTDPTRYLYAAKIFESNNMNDKAEELVRLAVEENPRSFESWKFLYDSSPIPRDKKLEILNKLKKLDPNNKYIK